MFRLTNRLALSNLIKNRKLYYPYTLATILVIAITYIFTSLMLNSHLDNLPGADSIKMVLGLGLVIVALSSGIIVLYANSFVMKNRSKELGLYSVLGLEKRHLFSMILKETMIMGVVTLLLGIGVGEMCIRDKFFNKAFPQVSYKTYAIVFTLIGFAIANLGLNNIIAFSVPVLLILYPITITIVMIVIANKFVALSKPGRCV